MKPALVTLLVAVCASTISALDPWLQFGPNGVTVAAMAGVPDYPGDVYLVPEGIPAQVFFTSNGGTSWTLRDTLPDRIRTIVVHPTNNQVLYAGGDAGSVWRSTNSGRSWTVRGSMPSGWGVRGLLVHAENELNMLAIADESDTGIRVYLSNDGGQVWYESLPVTGTEPDALVLAADDGHPNRVAAGGTASNRPVLFVSTDFGSSWADAGDGLGGTCAWGAAFSPTDSAVVVCATDAGIYRSTNTGGSWQRRIAMPTYSVDFSPVSPYYSYAGSDNVVLRSNNDGVNWFADSTAGFAGTGTRWLALNRNNALELYVGNGIGVFHTSNGGYRWSSESDDFECVTVPYITSDPHNATTMRACPPGYGVIVSNDGGRNWTREFTGLPNSGWSTGIAVHPGHPDTVAVVTSFDSDLHLTIDRGDSWVSHRVATNFQPAGVAYHPRGPDTLFAWGGTRPNDTAVAGFAVYRSTNRGQNWSDVLTRPASGFCSGFELPGSGDTLVAWGHSGGSAALFRSIDGGRNWLERGGGIAGAQIRDLAVSPSDPDDVWYAATASGVYRTLGGGDFWTKLGNLTGATAVMPDTDDSDIVLAGTDEQGIWRTTTGGNHWYADTLRLPGRGVTMLARQPGDSAGELCGIDGASLSGRGVIGITEPGPPPATGHERLDVTPSLIVGRARISVVSFAVGHALVDLYDTGGRLVRRVGELDGASGHIDWQRPPELSAGVYVLMVRQGNLRRSARVVLAPRD